MSGESSATSSGAGATRFDHDRLAAIKARVERDDAHIGKPWTAQDFDAAAIDRAYLLDLVGELVVEIEQWEEAEDRRVNNYCARCDAGEPLRMRWGQYGEYVSHAPDAHTAGMGCHREIDHRVQALYAALADPTTPRRSEP